MGLQKPVLYSLMLLIYNELGYKLKFSNIVKLSNYTPASGGNQFGSVGFRLGEI